MDESNIRLVKKEDIPQLVSLCKEHDNIKQKNASFGL